MSTNIEWTDATWRAIPGFDGYFVTRDGRIRGRAGREMRPMRSASGHLYIIARVLGRGRKLWVHTAVMLAFIGPRLSSKQEARHLNGRQSDNRIENLAWGTRVEQREDDRRNRVIRRPKRTRLTPEIASLIRTELGGGAGIRDCARRFGVSHTTVIGVRNGRLWREM